MHKVTPSGRRPCPSPERIEHGLIDELHCRMLHPHINNGIGYHHASPFFYLPSDSSVSFK
jgi:hypothetical protein